MIKEGVSMKIIPYTSVGSLKLNATSRQISSELNEEPDRFQKNLEDTTLSDHYKKSGVLVYYKENGQCDSIELTEGTEPEINGIHFLNMTKKKAKKAIFELDAQTIDLDDTFISKKLGVSLYLPYNKVETVMVFERGYYDELLELLKQMDEEI
jgi:hypothetical protein